MIITVNITKNQTEFTFTYSTTEEKKWIYKDERASRDTSGYNAWVRIR